MCSNPVTCGCCPYMPKRYIIVILTCLGMLIVHAMRVNIAVTVVTILDSKPHEKVGSIEAMKTLPEVEWDTYMIGILHAIFYIGYLITQIPGGYLCQVLPAHRLFGGCILLSCSLNLVLPVSITNVNFYFTCSIRAMQGLSEGILYPSVYAILRHWTTPEERSRMGAITLTGAYVGPVVGLIVSGYITHLFSWMYIFYVHGTAGIVWFLVWFFLSYESPAVHPSISPEELKKITTSQGQTAIIYEHDTVPWKSIFLSLPVNALNVCNFGRSFVFFFLLTNEPTFLNVFGYTIAENGVLSAVPHALMAFIAAISGPIADHMIADIMLTRTQVRKLFTCVGFGTEAVCLFFLVFIRDGTTALIFLSIGVGISGFTISGWQINHLDLAPRYASVIAGITTAVGTVAGIVNPILVGWMTTHQTIDEWQHVFIMTASVLVVTVLLYLVFGSGDKQPWSEPVPPKVTIIPSPDIMAIQPYGTFEPQIMLNDEFSLDHPRDFLSHPDNAQNQPGNSSSLFAGGTDDVDGSKDAKVGDNKHKNTAAQVHESEAQGHAAICTGSMSSDEQNGRSVQKTAEIKSES